jgi:hypothetical protein
MALAILGLPCWLFAGQNNASESVVNQPVLEKIMNTGMSRSPQVGENPILGKRLPAGLGDQRV